MKQKNFLNRKGLSENPSYKTIHNWLNLHYLKVACDFCGSSKALEFALRKGTTYGRFRDRFLVLCVTCHRRYDFTEKTRQKHKRKRSRT